MLLELKGIWVRYGKAEAVRGVTIEVDEGSVVAIVGANGAGKSTILKAVSGIIPMADGQLRFMGKSIGGMRPHDIVKLGIAHVPEGRKPFPYMSVLTNLSLGAFLQKDKSVVKRQLDEIFKRFPVLGQRRNQQAGTLSGGEQQMLAIGRALMARPKLLLMDEPSVGLAPIVINELGGVIRDINGSGVTILLVEQNASLVAKVSERVYVLEVGQVVLEGDIRELMANDLVRRAFLGG